MNRFKITLLFLGLFGQISFSQKTDQSRLLADHTIKTKQTYRSVVDHGRLTGDSVFLYTLYYNSKGYPVLGLNVQAEYAQKSVYGYLNDTLVLKMTTYKNDDTITSQRDYKYDAAGNLVQMQWARFVSPDSLPKISTSFMVYDQQNHLMETYDDYGKGKILRSVNEYDDRGNVVKYFFYYKKNGVPGIRVTKYDAQNNPTKAYSLHGRKKRLIEENKYNDLNQLVEKRTIPQRDYKMSSGGVDYNITEKDRIVIQYAYDANGLLIRETEYINSNLVYQFFYKYMQ